MFNKPERINHIYKKNSHMSRLKAHAQQLNKLNLILQQSLPLQFINHCTLANISAGKVVILTDKASYASLLRFQAPKICKALSAHLSEPVSQLEVKVRPQQALKESSAQHTAPLSTKTAALLESTAAAIEDGPLKTALNKLAKRQSNKL